MLAVGDRNKHFAKKSEMTVTPGDLIMVGVVECWRRHLGDGKLSTTSVTNMAFVSVLPL